MPAATPLGLPYPLPTEPVAEGAAAIRSLAEGVDGRLAIADQILAAPAATFDFTAIPATFRHLRLEVNVKMASGAANFLGLRINGVATADVYKSGVSWAKASGTTNQNRSETMWMCGRNWMRMIGDILIVDYARTALVPGFSSRFWCTYLDDSSGSHTADGYEYGVAGGFYTTPLAINRLTLLDYGARNFVVGSRVTLYGLS